MVVFFGDGEWVLVVGGEGVEVSVGLDKCVCGFEVVFVCGDEDGSFVGVVCVVG